jgi:outer membrane receptor protein involved in Fe transport
MLQTKNAGRFNLRLVLGYLHTLDQVGIPGAQAVNGVDQSNAPQWTANFSPTWSIGQVTVNYNLRWHDATLVYDRNTIAANPNLVAPQYFRYSALWQHDVQVNIKIDKSYSFYFGVNNLTDQKPDPYSYFTNTPISPLGRYYYAGAKFNLGH